MKETLQEKAYNWLLEKIKNRTYLAGTALKEEVIAKQIDISATPVREALRRLEREGWVENIPYRGCFLKEYTLEQLQEIAILRESLESAAIYFIIDNTTDEDWTALDKNIRDSETLVNEIEKRNGDVETFNKRAKEQDDEFHSILIKASRSEKLLEMSMIWNFQLQGFAIQHYNKADTCEYITGGKPQFYWIVEQHRAIYVAIRLGWEQAARELMRAHISTHCYEVIAEVRRQEEADKVSKSKKRKKRS